MRGVVRFGLGMLAVLVTACAAAPASAATPQRFGFNDTAWGNGAFPQTTFLDKLSGSGATVLRMPVHWHLYERNPGEYDNGFWDYHDDLYAKMQARGVKLIFELVGSPAWARTPGSAAACAGKQVCMSAPDVSKPAVMAGWRRFAREVASRYPGLAAIEIWNEPNIVQFWNDTQNPDAYVTLLQAATEEIRGAGFAPPILLGGVNNYKGANTTQRTNYTTWIQAMYARGAASSFDAISYHAYPCPNEPAANAEIDGVTANVRAVRNAAGDAATPLWLTEVGGTTSNTGAPANCNQRYTPEGQRDALGRSLDWAKAQHQQHGDLPVVTVHTLINPETRNWFFDPAGAEAEFGLVAWAQTPLGFRVEDKVAYARVACEFKGTC